MSLVVMKFGGTSVATAERTLFSDYRSYCWAVDRGMLTTEGGR